MLLDEILDACGSNGKMMIVGVNSLNLNDLYEVLRIEIWMLSMINMGQSGDKNIIVGL